MLASNDAEVFRKVIRMAAKIAPVMNKQAEVFFGAVAHPFIGKEAQAHLPPAVQQLLTDDPGYKQDRSTRYATR